MHPQTDRASRKAAKKAAKQDRVNKNKAKAGDLDPQSSLSSSSFSFFGGDGDTVGVGVVVVEEKRVLTELEEDEVIFDNAAKRLLKLPLIPRYRDLIESTIQSRIHDALFVYEEQLNDDSTLLYQHAGSMAIIIAEELGMDLIEALPELSSGHPEDAIGFIASHYLTMKMVLGKGLVKKLMRPSPMTTTLVEITEDAIELFQALATVYGEMDSMDEICQGESQEDALHRLGDERQQLWLTI